MQRRVMIFIDGSNFYHSIREMMGRVNVDYRCLVKKLVGGRELIRAYYYIPLINREGAEEQFIAQQRFLAYLQEVPYFQVKYGKLMRQGEILVEKSIDVLLAVDMVRYAALDTYDTAVLISGDGDFAPAVNVVKDLGKQVEVVFFLPQTSVELKQVSDIFIDLDRKYLENCIIYHSEYGDFNDR